MQVVKVSAKGSGDIRSAMVNISAKGSEGV
jgi:hypothetical protein